MPSPKSGQAGSAIAPTAPKEALEADKANPGEVEKIKAEQRQTNTGKYGATKSKSHKPDETKKSWIEIELVDDRGQPVSGEKYQVTLPDGETVATGTLDEKGFARVAGIDPGTCKVTFSEIEKTAWGPA